MNNNNICTPEVSSENPSPAGVTAKRAVRRGAPRGNQYARKHGAYSRYFDQELRERLSRAADMPVIDRELYLALIHAGRVVSDPPENERVMKRVNARLLALLCLKYDLRPDDQAGISAAVGMAVDKLARLEKAAGPLLGAVGLTKGIDLV